MALINYLIRDHLDFYYIYFYIILFHFYFTNFRDSFYTTSFPLSGTIFSYISFILFIADWK